MATKIEKFGVGVEGPGGGAALEMMCSGDARSGPGPATLPCG